jgi:enoyl-CoA hydratase
MGGAVNPLGAGHSLMSDIEFAYDVTDGVGTLTLSRPPVNAVTYDAVAAIDRRLSALPDGGEQAVVLETGGDRTFMAGHDVTEFRDVGPEDEPEITETYLSMCRAVFEFPLPLIAAIDGPAIGAGCIIATLCDVRVASPEAAFGLPEVDIGIIGGLGALQRVLPEALARRAAYTGKPVTAERAHAVGMVAELAEDPTQAAQTLAGTIAEKSPAAVRAAKASAIEGQTDPVAAYARERAYNEELRESEEAQAALAEYLEEL